MYHICMAKMEQNGLRLELGQKECFCTKYTVLGGFFLLWIVFGWPPSPIQFYLKFNLGSGQWKVHGEIQLEEIVDARFLIHLQRTHCPGHWVEFKSQTRLLFQFQNYMERAKVRDGRPAPRGRGGSPPRPALWGGGGFPAPPRPVDFWPCPSPPRPVTKIASPPIPAWNQLNRTNPTLIV